MIITNYKTKNILFLLKYTKKYKRDIFFALFFIILATSSILYIGFLVKDLVRNISYSKDISRTCIYILGMVCVSSLGVFGRIYFFGSLGERLIKDLRDSLFKHIIGLDVFFFEANRTGDIISRIMSDSQVIQIVFIGSASSAVRNSIMLLGSSVMLSIININLTILLLIGFLLISYQGVYFGRKIRDLSKQAQSKSADISSTIEESINSIKTIKSFNYESKIFELFSQRTEDEYRVICQRIIYFGLSVSLNSIASFLLIVGIISVAYANPMLYSLSTIELSAFAYYGMIAGYTFSQFNDLVADFYRASGATDKIIDLLNIQKSLITIKEENSVFDEPESYLTFENVSFHYPSNSENLVLDNFNFKLQKGEKVAIVGASGSGKSTIFNLILRFYDPIHGNIKFKGHSLKGQKFADYYSSIAIVPQDPFIFSTTVAENITLGNHSTTFQEMVEAAKLSYSLDFIKNLPQGFHTYLGEKGIRLSGGQKQRLAIARAIIKKPDLLLLDEATSSLDSESEDYIKNSLKIFLKNKTSLIIAHRLSTILDCDRIIVIDKGKIVDVGQHYQLLKRNDLYARLANLQFVDKVTSIVQTTFC